MALNIKDETTCGLVRELAKASGESQTGAVRRAVEERLERLRKRPTPRASLADRLDEIALHCASLPIRRRRSEDEILGYDERGLPGGW
jgi:antitoxin VapB